jgi:hypothetical protein
VSSISPQGYRTRSEDLNNLDLTIEARITVLWIGPVLSFEATAAEPYWWPLR